MISKYIIPVMFVFSLSCNGQTMTRETEEIVNAKWYFYSYAMELKAYDKSGIEVQPLACDIKLLRESKISADTTKLYFVAFSKDSFNICTFKPLDVLGITIVRNKLYLPIYHSIVFDRESDSLVLARMNKQSLFLRRKVFDANGNINLWLQAEAKKR